MEDKFESKEHKQFAEGIAALGLIAGLMIGLFTMDSTGGWLLITLLGGVTGSAIAMVLTKLRR